jgi:hypothetical protein
MLLLRTSWRWRGFLSQENVINLLLVAPAAEVDSTVLKRGAPPPHSTVAVRIGHSRKVGTRLQILGCCTQRLSQFTPYLFRLGVI